MWRMTGKLNGRGHRQYVVTMFPDDYERVKAEGAYYTNKGVWRNLEFTYVPSEGV